MTRQISQRGFTLLEILVASMLMAMLVTILTMVFNSSSIAWSTGKSSVAEMNSVRRTMSASSIAADNALPRADKLGEWGYLVSPWKAGSDRTLRPRGVVKMNGGNDEGSKAARQTWNNKMESDFKTARGVSARDTGKKLWAEVDPGRVNAPDNAKAFVVGVWSWGPDGSPDTEDDICTWPDVE